VPAPPIPTAEYELPGSWKEEARPEHAAVAPAAEPEPEITATPVEVAPDPVVAEAEPETVAMEPLADPEISAIPVEAAEAVSAAAEPAHPHFIPVYKEPEPQPQPEAAAYEVLPTAAPPTGDIEIPREPELQETADETTRATVADRIEPGLMSTLESVADAARKASAEELPASWPSSNNSGTVAREAMEVASGASESPASGATAEVSDADFEARVAAAMAAYSHATAPIDVHESPVVAPVEIQPEPPADSVVAAEAKPEKKQCHRLNIARQCALPSRWKWPLGIF
jgi:hypothetical protein